MNHITRALVRKDIQLNLIPLALYFLLRMISLWMMTSSQLGVFNAGAVIMLSKEVIYCGKAGFDLAYPVC